MFNKLIELAHKKQIILLGESAHGVSEFNLIRVDLIKNLHELAKYKVVIIESIPFGFCRRLGDENLLELVQSCLHPVYQTNEVLELFQYIKRNDLMLAGIELTGAELRKYKEIKKKDYQESLSFRDRIMFRNFNLLFKKILEPKIIVWAHNNHIMKKTSPAANRDKVVGEYLFEKYGDRVLSVGQYAGSGSFEHMPGELVDHSVLPKDSLSDFIMNRKCEMEIFSDLNNPRFNKPIATLACSRTVETITLSDHFDSLILHKEGHPTDRL